MIKTGKVYFSVFFILLIFLCVIFGAGRYVLFSYLSLLIHEGFHLAAALKMKINVNRILILPFGINIEINKKIPAVYEIILCMMGPIGSCIAFALFLCMKFQGIAFEYLDYLIISNFSVFMINILPIYPLDGGRVLKCILESKIGYYKAVNMSIWISQIFVLCVCAAIFLAVTVSNFNLSIMVLCCFLIYSLSLQKKEAVTSFAQMLVYSKQKLTERGMLNAKEIVVGKQCMLKDIVSMLSDNVYLIVSVTDSDGTIICRMSETEMIERFCRKKSAKSMLEIV